MPTLNDSDGINLNLSGSQLNVSVDSTVVRTSGAQAIAGVKTFNDDIRLAAGRGINFSAYGAGAAIGSNLLDDYEEGTWTPTVGNGTSTYTITINGATYTKIGNIVSVFASIAIDSASITGDIIITPLPFSAAVEQAGSVYVTGAATAVTIPVTLYASGSDCYVRGNFTTGTGNNLATNLDADSAIRFSVTYQTS